MFKFFVLLSLYLATISCLPSSQHGVEKVDVAVETEPNPQAFPVPVAEPVLKANLANTKNVEEPINTAPLKSAEATDVAVDAPSALVESENSPTTPKPMV